MASVLTLVVILALSVVITRIATVALTHTGMSRSTARFQARSAFTGVGFTTQEAERVTYHPVRRRIIMILMLVGNVGLVSALATLLLTYIGPGENTLGRTILLVAGVTVVWLVSSSRWIDRWLSALIDRALQRWTDLDVRDYAQLLKLAGDYGVTELEVREGDWLADHTLAELDLRDEGVLVLGVDRADGTYLGVPERSTHIEPGDTLILYGRSRALRALDTRGKGDAGQLEHDRAVDDQRAVTARERASDESRRSGAR